MHRIFQNKERINTLLRVQSKVLRVTHRTRLLSSGLSEKNKKYLEDENILEDARGAIGNTNYNAWDFNKDKYDHDALSMGF